MKPLIGPQKTPLLLIVLLLLAICAIPFALAQRNPTKRSAAKPSLTRSATGPNVSGIALSRLAKLPAPISSAVRGQANTQAKKQLRRGPAFVEIGTVSEPQLRTPKAPAVVLYDQYDSVTGTGFESNFHADDPAFVDYMADDFVVPGGETWTITEVDALGLQFGAGGATFNVAFYTNGAGNLPDTQVYSTNNGTYTTNGMDWVITIPAAILTPGTYWVMLQGNGSNNPFNSWFWTGRSVQSNDTAAWQQPGNAYGRNCITWERKPICFSEIPNNPDQVFRIVGTIGGGGTPTPTPTPTATPGGCQFHVLVVYADTEGLPTQLQSEIQAEPNVVAVDLFDATVGTPTLGQLQQYEIVVPFSNSPFLDGDTLGNNLADYVDGGGIVVQHGFSHLGPGQPYGINGRWLSGNYNPYDYSQNFAFNPFTLGTFNAGHPLMAGVTSLNSDFQNIVTPAAGATEVAATNLATSLVAFRPVSGGHTTVGVTAYVGFDATQSGDWGKVIVNAGNWLGNCQGSPTGLLYGSTGDVNASGGGRLWLIDVTSQSATLVGNTGFDRLGGIAFDSNGTLYGVSGGATHPPSTLLTIDPMNGQATVIGLISDTVQGVDGVRFNSQGVLYGVSWDNNVSVGKLLTIDPSNGDVLTSLTLVGSGDSFCAGIALNPLDVLYGSRGGGSRNEDIDLIDPVTGVLTPLGPTETTISDIAFAPDGTLYGSSPNGNLYTIDPLTGAKTLLFNTGIAQLSGLAAAPASPTPTPTATPTATATFTPTPTATFTPTPTATFTPTPTATFTPTPTATFTPTPTATATATATATSTPTPTIAPRPTPTPRPRPTPPPRP